MKRLGYSLLYLSIIHIIALFIFFIFRLYLYGAIDYEFASDINFTTKATAFIKGLWFDNVIACYITILPLALLCIANFFKRIPRFIFNTCAGIYGILFSISFIISAANVPYFIYFFNNINSSIFNWVGYGATTAGMIFEEQSYYLPMLCFLVSTIIFWWLTIKLTKRFYLITATQKPLNNSLGIKQYALAGIVSVSVIGLCIFGIRGRTGYNPIKVSQAYYCQDPFLNQLGISPTFNLLTSYLDDMRKENKPIDLLPDDTAITNVQHYLKRQGIEGISPIARMVKNEKNADSHKNVIIIFMESMSAHLMSACGYDKNITPYLDSLYNVSRTYTNFYSSGLHTNHGIYATLYSFPTILKRNAMKGTRIPSYSGLPTVLADNGYHNMFFMTHESQYDNMNAFFRTNGFHEIHSEENYPAEKRANSFGVQDDYLFTYALSVINDRAKSGQPFFSVLLTVSNHPPYVIPTHFKPKSKELNDQIVEYADWSISQFMTEAKKQPWWNNTIFILLGDHGKLVNTPECEMPQAHNHIPLIIHSNDIKPEIIDDFAGQIDIAPTILDMLGISYTQNNFGINLNNEKRPCAFYTNDKHIAARNSTHLYIYEPQEDIEYFYSIINGNPVAAQNDSTFNILKKYCFSMLQSAQYMQTHQLTTTK